MKVVVVGIIDQVIHPMGLVDVLPAVFSCMASVLEKLPRGLVLMIQWEIMHSAPVFHLDLVVRGVLAGSA